MRFRLTGGIRSALATAARFPLVAALVVGACATQNGRPAPATPPTEIVRLYGADGNMTDSFGAAFKAWPGALSGMRGTTRVTRSPRDFKTRVLAVDPRVVNFDHTGEAYDAAVVAAITAEYARTTDPRTLAKHLVAVTTGGKVCETVSACLTLAREGVDLQYRGISLSRGGLTDIGEPSTATYGTATFASDNTLDVSRADFVDVGDAGSQAPQVRRGQSPPFTVPLRLGGLLPRTGGLADAAPAMSAAIRLAIKEINEAGGVLGYPVAWVDGDDGNSATVARATVDRFVERDVHVVVGGGSSALTKDVLPRIVEAGLVLISATATSDDLSTVEDGGLFFRTAPPDRLQARALADMIVRDGPKRVAVVAIDDPYGADLRENVFADLVNAGMPATSVRRVKYPVKDVYDPNKDIAGIFGPIADEIKAFGPDAILVVGFDESAYLIQILLAKNVIKSDP